MPRTRRFPAVFAIALICLSAVCGLSAQTGEINTKETAVTFKSGVSLVPVPVVVRDGKGKTVSNLGIEDFQLFDNGKPQMISKFTVEKLARTPETPGAVKPVDKSVAPDKKGETLVDATSDGIPDRFVAYVFDDLHMGPADIVYTRDAARRQIDSPNHAMERVAIYSTSGRPTQEFTGDREKLHAALAQLMTGRAGASKAMMQSTCPPMTYYMGYLITEKDDKAVLDIAVADTMKCANLMASERDLAISLSRSAGRSASSSGERDSQDSLYSTRNIVAKLASMPGQRTIVVISPGFLVTENLRDLQTDIIDRAIRANIVIGALDARGLYTDTGMPDASEKSGNIDTLTAKATYRRTESMIQSDVMATLADGTGGTFYHGTNDYDEGIARTAAAPDVIYVLGFNPLDLKLDGKYHNLKVTLKSGRGMDLQVRKGYYAAKYGTDPAEKAKQEMEEAFFSRDEIHDLPAVLQTQYFKADNGDVTLSAVSKIDVKKLALRKEGDRNLDNVTVLMGLFDNDGNFVSGIQKIVELRLLDDTLEKRIGSGIGVKNSFTVRPGRYIVRMVVRDTEGQVMTEQSSLVEIP